MDETKAKTEDNVDLNIPVKEKEVVAEEGASPVETPAAETPAA